MKSCDESIGARDLAQRCLVTDGRVQNLIARAASQSERYWNGPRLQSAGNHNVKLIEPYLIERESGVSDRSWNLVKKNPQR